MRGLSKNRGSGEDARGPESGSEGAVEGVRQPRHTASPRSRAEWRAIVERWRSSGLTTAEFCRDEGKINPRTLQWWSSRLKRDPRYQVDLAALPRAEAPVQIAGLGCEVEPAARFLQVDLVHRDSRSDDGDSRADGGGREFAGLDVVLPQGRCVRVYEGFDSSALRSLVRVLEGLE